LYQETQGPSSQLSKSPELAKLRIGEIAKIPNYRIANIGAIALKIQIESFV
jgi:hypothetical protein